MIDTTYETADRDRQFAHQHSPAQSQAISPAQRGSHTGTQAIPSYMTEVYDWAYVNPSWVRWLDHDIVVKTLLFCNDRRLMKRYLDRVQNGMHVWQVAHVYGDLVQQVAQRVGHEGRFDLTDVTPIQIAHAHSKLDALPQARIIQQDAAVFQAERPYDLVCSFMLLHEIPEDWKRRVVDNMLAQVSEGGEVIFVDYHRPAVWHPVRYILKLVNRWLEPFANALWEHEIREYASRAEDYQWTKETLFGGVYQMVRVTRKAK